MGTVHFVYISAKIMCYYYGLLKLDARCCQIEDHTNEEAKIFGQSNDVRVKYKGAWRPASFP